MRVTLSVAVSFLLLCAGFSYADAPPAGASDYLDGLNSLEQAKFGDAVAQMGRAIDADEENPDYRIGRAVALIFSEKLPDAQQDLERADKLRPNDRSAKLWLASAVAMQGDFQHDSDIYPFATFGDQFGNSVRQMSHNYGQYFWQKAENQRTGFAGGGVDDHTKAAFAIARAQFPRLAKQFAVNAEAGLQGSNAGLATVVRDRAMQRLAQKDYAGALSDLTRLMSTAPDDAQLMNAHAACLLALGCPFLARAESTRVLTQDINNADAYATRAVAAAVMGDASRAGADLKIIAELNPARVADAQANVAAANGQAPAAFKAEELVQRVNELRQMAVDGKPWDALVAEAIAINKGQNSIRKRFDESYQEQLRDLTLASQKDPKDAEALAALGDFIYRNAIDIPGEAVEPRAQFRSYRLLNEQGQQAEMTHAQQCLDAALAIDPQNMHAVTAKADMLIHQSQWGDAETMLRQALAVKPGDPRLLDLFARVMDYAASTRNAKAEQMRTPTSWIGGMYIWTSYPSQAELDQADEIDQQADQLWSIANNSMQAAADAMKGTANGFNYASVIAQRNGNLDEAIADLEQAVKLAPERADYHQALGDLYAQKGLIDQAADQRAIGVNLVQTTAAPMLRLAWTQIPMTKFKSAKESLNRAIALDAADPRAEAYLGMIYAGDSKPREAVAWMLAAAAMDEAEARFEGRSATSTAIGDIPPSRVGLGIAIDLKEAGFCLRQKNPELAQAVLRLAIAAGARVPAESIYAAAPPSMLPDSNNTTPSVVVPPAHSVQTMMAWAHLYLAQALAAQKPDDATAELKTVLGYAHVPPTVDAGMEYRMPVAYAAYTLAIDSLRRKDPQSALNYLNGNGPPDILAPREFLQKYNDLFNQARMEMQNGGGGQVGPGNGGGSPGYYPPSNNPRSNYPPTQYPPGGDPSGGAR